MSTPAKLAAFAAALAVLFGGGALAGGAIDPNRDTSRAEHTAAAAENNGAHGAEQMEDQAMSSTSPTETGAHGAVDETADPVRGLAVAEHGLRVVVDDPELRRGRTERLHYRIVDERDQVVRDFDIEHAKRMHLIVARRDLTGFRHLHPKQAADGTWTTDITLAEAGSYRLFADFAKDDMPYTLASDLRVDGPADLRPLPAPAPTAVSDGGYDVRLDESGAHPEREADLRFTITENGRTVHTEPYLGAAGHLVALREGDMAFLHVHPADGGHADSARSGRIGFMASFPTEGRYRLFLQFKHEGRVHTVAFTQEVK